MKKAPWIKEPFLRLAVRPVATELRFFKLAHVVWCGTTAVHIAVRYMPLSGRNRSFFFNGGLDIVEILHEGLFRYPFE
jgi:hypothetical protein